MAHAATQADLSPANTRLDAAAGAVITGGLIVGVLGIVGSMALAWLGGEDPSRFWRVWIHNFMFVLSLALGGLFFVLIQHLTRAGWSVAVRRIAEAFAANLRWLWILFVPVLGLWFMGRLGTLFPWADLETLRANAPLEADLVAAKSSYLNPQFFFIRAAIYFVIWMSLGVYFWSRSTRQDSEGGIEITRRMQKAAAPGIILFGLTTTFAAFDWIMSLNPAWFSTIFGVYFFAGCCTGSFAAMAITILLLQRGGKLIHIISPEHLQDVGKMLFAFGMVFWAYIGFSQYMLIWYANLPETTGFFIARQIGDWKWVTIALLFGHFVVPFLLFISKHPKRIPVTLLFVASWMLFFHWIDLYWLIMPEIPHDLGAMRTYNDVATKYADTSNHLLNPLNWTMLLGMSGLFVAFTVQSLRAHALLPVRDPRLAESLAFENI